MLIVLDRHLHDGTADVRGDSNNVRTHISIVGTWIYIIKASDKEAESGRSKNNRHTDRTANHSEARMMVRGRGDENAIRHVDNRRRVSIGL